MKKKKIFILLPDGVGLRNFAYTNFYNIGLEYDFEITYWNNTPFDLKNLGFNEIRINNAKLNTLTDIYKSAKIHCELNSFTRRFNDQTYQSYKFPFSQKTLKNKVKTFLTQMIIKNYDRDEKLPKLRDKIRKLELSTNYFKECLKTLQKEQPDFVFCTNQRHLTAIAPIEAAKKIGIPTGTFIFSWDNLPKATIVIETDYYFVWSDYMKNELLKYYPHVKEEQVIVTGTPQFENHFNSDFKIEKKEFYNKYNLDLDKKYLCFSGDDITTSPNDPIYLKDTAEAIRRLNQKGHNLGVIFRACPTDFSSRYDAVLEQYSDIITPIKPLWKKISDGWHTILPTKEDLVLQTNIIAHTEFVVNVGSSMVFDYISYNKPCVYLNYEVDKPINPNWKSNILYKFIHFRSMPSTESVIWFNDINEIEIKIEAILKGNTIATLENAQKWFKIINQHPADKSSERIWLNLKKIINEKFN